jgi:phospholipase C
LPRGQVRSGRTRTSTTTGRNDGFVVSGSGPVARGYWTRQDLPFTYDLATQFPIADRWFCGVLGQTDPNRRYLIAATSVGMTDDIGTSRDFRPRRLIARAGQRHDLRPPELSTAAVSWADYNVNFPEGATMELVLTNDSAFGATNAKPIAQSSPTPRPGCSPVSACSTRTTRPSRRRTLRTSPWARRSSSQWSTPLAAHRRGRARD